MMLSTQPPTPAPAPVGGPGLRRALGCALALSLLGGCGDAEAPAAGAPNTDTPAADTRGQVRPLSGLTGMEAFQAAEAILSDDGVPVALNFDVQATGAMGAQVAGSLLMGDGGRARLEATGTFGDQPLDAVLISDGERMFWTGGPPEGTPTPPSLREALAVGFMRMGILHNLARLSGAAPPDHAQGGAPEWVVVTNTEDRSVLEGMDTGAGWLWNITVEGQPAGSFGMVFADGEPSVRRQRVQFPGGIMQVVERYPAFTTGAPVPPGAFDTTPLDPSR